MGNKKGVLAFTAALFWCLTATAANDTTNPTHRIPGSADPGTQGETVTTPPTSGPVTRTGSQTLMVRIENSCFGTNLRSVSNPVSPNGIITANVTLADGSRNLNFRVSYPGDLVAAAGMTAANIHPADPSTYHLPTAGGRVGIFGHTIQVEIPQTYTETVHEDGTTTREGDIFQNFTVDASFSQEMRDCSGPPAYGQYGQSATTPAYPCGQYMGRTGPLAANVSPAVISADGTSVVIPVAFPGQTGFCGGYFSPLMVFFDEKRPDFSAVTEFPLNPIGRTAWPEKGAPGAFLVVDKKHTGKITKKDQVFGEDEKHANGFESLREYDSNKDGAITSKDKGFKDLFLWFDKNGDGVSQKGELVRLGDKVLKISLDYTKGHLEPIGQFAEERETADVILKNKKKARIADIWLSPIMRANPGRLGNNDTSK